MSFLEKELSELAVRVEDIVHDTVVQMPLKRSGEELSATKNGQG